MKYLQSFEDYRPELAGQLVNDDEDIIYPMDKEITGHIGSQIKKVRLQKVGKSPKRQKSAAPNYPEMQLRNNLVKTELNALPSQS